MHLGIVKYLFTCPVEEYNGVQRLRIVLFQKRYTYCHLKFFCELSKLFYELTVLTYCQSFKLFLLLRKIVAAVPHLRKQRYISALLLCFNTAFLTDLKILA